MKSIYILSILALFFTSCTTTTVSPVGSDFWDHHGWMQLLGWMFFPRIMFWLFSVITGGFWFWVGVFFTPHLMVAFWATTYYWSTNPAICLFAWVWALIGMRAEESTAKKSYNRFK